jgi:anti-sigma B factor antagonist
VARAGDVEVTRQTLPGGAVVIHVEGELDLATSDTFEDALGASDPGGQTVIDLTECTFIDSSAVRLFVEAARAAQETQGQVSLVTRDPGILRVLEIAAVDTMLPVHDSVEAAI